MKKDLLIEVYTEELPISCVSEFNSHLPSVVETVLKNFKVEYKNLKTYVTPVRLIVHVNDVSELTQKEVVEITGPPVSVGLKDGKFTQQGIGFAKKYNVDLKEIFIKDTDKGKVLAVKKIYGGEEVKSKISEILKEILIKLTYPKMMVWEKTKFRFPRPIRNLVILWGNEFVKIKLLSELTSSNFTYGIKTYPIKKLKIHKLKKLSLIESYFQILKEECIIYDFEKRYQTLVKSLDNICSKKDLKYDNDEKLLTEIVSIVEYPTCVLCSFPEEFLSLPEEFIITCLKSKQKFIPLYDKKGKLTNQFVGVKNGPSEYLENVKDGFEKVLIARLQDVKYYYETDKKKEFDTYFDQLQGIVYHSKLDSLYNDKVLRIKQLAEFLNKELNFNIQEQIIEVTAKLIKNDLLTQIVYEYPELQGIAGYIYCSEYCRKHSLPEEVAVCCKEHYLPKSYDDKVPTNKLSILFSLSNKLSDVIDMAITKDLPRGSSDVYGLKKTADSVIKICHELKLDLNLSKIIKFYLEHPITRSSLSGQNVNWSLPLLPESIVNFFSQRLENIFLEEGYKIDEVRAVLSDFNGEFYTKGLILSIIKEFRQKQEFIKLIELYKRVNNILVQARKKGFVLDGEVDTELLKLEQEIKLYNESRQLKQTITELVSKKEFDKIILLFLEFKPVVDNFFDKVLVFDEEKNLAGNRLRLLNYILQLFKLIAAFEHIQI